MYFWPTNLWGSNDNPLNLIPRQQKQNLNMFSGQYRYYKDKEAKAQQGREWGQDSVLAAISSLNAPPSRKLHKLICLRASTPILPFEPLGRHHCTRHRHAWLNLWPLVTKSAIRPSPQWLCEGLKKSPISPWSLLRKASHWHWTFWRRSTSLPRTLNSSCVRTQRWRPNTYFPIPSHPSTFSRLPSPKRNGSGKCFWLSPGTLAPPSNCASFHKRPRRLSQQLTVSII